MSETIDPNELRAKLEAIDAQLRDKLREIGLSPYEIAQITDPTLPAEERRRRTQEALAASFVRQVAAPNSPLLAEVLNQLDVERLGAQLPALVAAEQARLRRKRIAIGVGVASVLLALGTAAYFALRTPNPCAVALGPVGAWSARTGRRLEADKPIGSFSKQYGSCAQYVWESDGSKHVGNPAIIVNADLRDTLRHRKQEAEGRRFVSNEALPDQVGGWIFVAGDLPQPSADELVQQAMQSARRPRARSFGINDPMGDALARMPPGHHLVLLERNGILYRIELERHMFTPTQAKDAATEFSRHLARP